jgi:cell division protein DivIC
MLLKNYWSTKKYLLAAIGFIVWMLFFDDQDIITTFFRHRQELHRLEASRDYFQREIKAIEAELHALKSDPAKLEKYAREKYKMKKDNEDLFIIPD